VDPVPFSENLVAAESNPDLWIISQELLAIDHKGGLDIELDSYIIQLQIFHTIYVSAFHDHLLVRFKFPNYANSWVIAVMQKDREFPVELTKPALL
jgi:hypothetical protein